MVADTTGGGSSDVDGAPSSGTPQGPVPDSPPWTSVYGGEKWDAAFDLVQGVDGGYLVVGTTGSKGAGSHDVWILRLDPDGEALWDLTYGGPHLDEGAAVAATGDGFLVAGSTSSDDAAGIDAWLLSLSPDGALRWDAKFGVKGSQHAEAIVATGDGGAVLVGSGDPAGNLDIRVWVAKTDASGGLEWEHHLGSGVSDQGHGACSAPSDGYVAVGSTRKKDMLLTDDAWVLRLDAQGNVLWDQVFGDSGWDSADAVSASPGGGYVVVGHHTAPDTKVQSAWVLKLAEDGALLWDKKIGGELDTFGESVVPLGEDGFVVAGSTYPEGSTTGDGWVARLDATGTPIWQKTYGGNDDDIINVIRATMGGGYIAAGRTRSKGSGAEDMWVLKLDISGSACSSEPEEKAYKGCVGNEVTWFDECDVPGEAVEVCVKGLTCSGGECQDPACQIPTCSVTGFQYTCSTGDSTTTYEYNGPGPGGVDSYTTIYSNGHAVTCSYITAGSGVCNDEQGASCSF